MGEGERRIGRERSKKEGLSVREEELNGRRGRGGGGRRREGRERERRARRERRRGLIFVRKRNWSDEGAGEEKRVRG